MTDIRIKEATENESKFIAYLQSLPDAELQKKLSIIRRQEQLAFSQKNENSLLLLQQWEKQVIEARYRRNEADVVAERKTSAMKINKQSQPLPFICELPASVTEELVEEKASKQLRLF